MSLPEFSPYTFGCMSIAKDLDHIPEDVALVREAMESGIWFHCSPTYHSGFSFMTLRMAFDQARSQVPRLIVKVRDRSAELLRFEAEDICRRLGIDGIDVAQLVSMDRGPGCLVSELVAGEGPILDALHDLRERGVIRRATVFVNPDNADDAAKAVDLGRVDGLTCYWNAYQNELSPTVWERVKRNEIGLVAIRTLAGAEAQRDPEKQAAVNQAMEASGCADEVELNLRLAASFYGVRTTIGGTRSPEHFRRFLQEAERAEPLPAEVLERLVG